MFDLKIDLQVITGLSRITQQIEVGAENGLDRAAIIALQAKMREQEKTYARPIPKTGKGTPRWTRSGDWLREQTIRRQRGIREIFSRGNSEKYEARLANLPTGPDGVNRSNPASETALGIVEDQILAVVEQEIRNALGL